MLLWQDLPRVHRALDLLGDDNGATVWQHAVVPPEWEWLALVAESELSHLSWEETQDLVCGEHSVQEVQAERCPVCWGLLDEAFDGELVDSVFRAWGENDEGWWRR